MIMMLSTYVSNIMNAQFKELIEHSFDFDLENGKIYWKNVSKHHNKLNGKEAGMAIKSRNNKYYWVIKLNGKAYKRSRLIYFYVNGYFPHPCIDHIDGNSLNDKPSNLRQATVTQNSWNHKGRKKKSNLPMGIRKQGNKYVARISYNKKQITIGSFDDIKTANAAYENKRIELYGNFCGY